MLVCVILFGLFVVSLIELWKLKKERDAWASLALRYEEGPPWFQKMEGSGGSQTAPDDAKSDPETSE